MKGSSGYLVLKFEASTPAGLGSGSFFKIPNLMCYVVYITLNFSVRTCGKPNIQNIMNNVTARPGQTATFKCQVDMSCIVSYIEWYHEMDNGTEKLIKVSSSTFLRTTFFLESIYLLLSCLLGFGLAKCQ